jgi:extracellular matrix regulatory protein A
VKQELSVGVVATEILNIGFGNVVLRSRIVAILSARSSKDSKAVFSEPMKRLRDDAREGGRLVDATCGRRTQTLVVTDSGHVVLSAIQSSTLAQRLGGSDEVRERT